MRYYLIAGEASGDIYGSQLISEIQILDPNSKIRFWGGDLMKSKSNIKSFAGYPVKAISGKTIISAFFLLFLITSLIKSALPSRSPTVEFNCDNATIIIMDLNGPLF